MVRIVLALVRAVVGVLFAAVGVLSAAWGLYFLGRQNSRLFGSEGVLLLVGVLVAAAFWAASRKMLRGIARPAAAAAALPAAGAERAGG
jgi:hypothetical protein